MFSFLRQDMMMSLVRHALTWGSGVMVAKGAISEDMATQGVSLAVGIAGLILSAMDKRQRQHQVTGLSESLNELEAQKTHDQQAWQVLQTELSELRRENQHYQQQSEAVALAQQAEPMRRAGPQARYQQVSVSDNRGFVMSHQSRQKMQGVHPLLKQVVETAMSLSAVDFKVTEGVRSAERQAELLADGRSWVKTSKHQADPTNGLGHAVDVMALPTPEGSWDWEHYEQINDAMQAASKRHNARITWGGCWATKDGCHFQLDAETK